MTTTVKDLGEFKDLVGQQVGYSDWVTIDQDRINRFAEATNDHQWIHVDPERAAKGPFGKAIAHGYLTLSLIPGLLGSVLRVEGISMGINYGCNKVRFPSPVPVDSELRMGVTVTDVKEVGDAVQVVMEMVLQVRDAAKPSCVAEVVYRYYR